MYFRFFLPEEYYCHSVVVRIRPYYGSPTLLLSSKTAYPDFVNYGWRQVWHLFFFFFGFFVELKFHTFRISNKSTLVLGMDKWRCVRSFTKNTQWVLMRERFMVWHLLPFVLKWLWPSWYVNFVFLFDFFWFLSNIPQAHPLPPPPVKIACSSVPQSAIDAAKSVGNPVFCLEDGVETIFTEEDVNPRYEESLVSLSHILL